MSVSHISPTEHLFVLKTLSRTQRAMKVKKFVGICLKRLRSRVMPRNMSEKANMLIIPTYRCQLSPLDTQRRASGYPTIVNNIQPCPKLCLLMPLARVGARTGSTFFYKWRTYINLLLLLCTLYTVNIRVLCLLLACM